MKHDYRKDLNPAGKKVWDRITSQITLGKDIYGETLYLYCKEFVTWEKCWKALDKKGMTTTTESGYEQQRPEVSIAAAALKNIQAIAHKFGFDPYGTKKIGDQKKDPKTSTNKNKGRGFRKVVDMNG